MMMPGEMANNTSVRQYPCFAVVIANPTSGSYSQHVRQVEETLIFLHDAGWEIELQLTKEAGNASLLARQAVMQKVDVVIVAGGDGIINEVIQELAGSETALGVLPFGTVNVWAREMNIPLDVNGAREVLLNGEKLRVDLGKVNDRYFLLMAGIGFDADVTHAVEKKPIKRLGVLGYLLVGTWLGLAMKVFASFNHRWPIEKKNACKLLSAIRSSTLAPSNIHGSKV
jgi:YegS/Rv2252/BmrU family lipid kinase